MPSTGRTRVLDKRHYRYAIHRYVTGSKCFSGVAPKKRVFLVNGTQKGNWDRFVTALTITIGDRSMM